MTADDDKLLALVGSSDPARDEDPPGQGSDRRSSILEFAMQTEHATPDASAGPSTRRRRRSRRLVAGLAASAVVATVGFVALQSNGAPTAEAAVSSAADAMGAVTSLEGELTSSTPGANDRTSRIRVDGDDLEIVGETRYADGRVERSTFTVVNGTGYETVGGRTTSTPVAPDDGLAPFGPSSEAVVAAALEGSNVSERGDDTVDGVATTRYDLRLTEASTTALSALTPGELAWFELEYPDSVRTLSVWVADGLVRQIEIDHRDKLTRTRFFNFNDDITVTEPPGPYVEPGDN